MKFTASDLNKRITIRRKSERTRDEYGGVIPAQYLDLIKLWANVRYKSAIRKQYMDEAVNYVPVYFVVRENDVKLTDQIRYDSETYEILNITKLDGIPKFLEIEARTLRGI